MNIIPKDAMYGISGPAAAASYMASVSIDKYNEEKLASGGLRTDPLMYELAINKAEYGHKVFALVLGDTQDEVAAHHAMLVQASMFMQALAALNKLRSGGVLTSFEVLTLNDARKLLA